MPESNKQTTPLITAVCNGDIETVRKLLENGADINERGSGKMNALHEAALSKQNGIVKLLLEKKADINLQDNKGCSALHHAALSQNVEAIRMLVDEKADLNLQTDSKYTALHIATIRQNVEAVKILVDAKAKLNLQDNQGHSALHYALMVNNVKIIEMLIAEKADLNLQDNEGCSALHYAAMVNNVKITEMLAKEKAKLNLKAHSKKYTALHIAAIKKNPEIVNILLQAGADCNIIDRKFFPMDYAYLFCDEKLIELFKQKNGISTIHERKLVHLGLNISSEYDLESQTTAFSISTLKKLIEQLTPSRIDTFKKNHPEKKAALSVLSDIIKNIEQTVSDLKEIVLEDPFLKGLNPNIKDNHTQHIQDYQTKCKNLKLGEHCIIASGYREHRNYLVVNLQKDGKYRVQLCERGYDAVMQNGRAVIPYIIVSNEELNMVIEQAIQIKNQDEESARDVVFGGKYYTGKLFGFKAKIRDDISTKPFKLGICSFANLKTATRLVLMDNVEKENQKLREQDRVLSKDVYKVYSAAIFDIALEDYEKTDNTLLKGEAKEKIIEQGKSHSEKKWESPLLNQLLDLILPPSKKSSAIKNIITVHQRTYVYHDSLKKILVDGIIKDKELTDALKNNQDKLELYANSLLRALSDIEFKGLKGAYFIKNREKTASNLLYTIANFIISALSCIVTLSAEPIKKWYNDKPQIIVWSPKKFDEFLQDPNKHITAEQIAKGKQTLANIIKAEFEREKQGSPISFLKTLDLRKDNMLSFLK